MLRRFASDMRYIGAEREPRRCAMHQLELKGANSGCNGRSVVLGN